MVNESLGISRELLHSRKFSSSDLTSFGPLGLALRLLRPSSSARLTREPPMRAGHSRYLLQLVTGMLFLEMQSQTLDRLYHKPAVRMD